MKKLILSLFIFCSAFASAQISIPQVTGLPAALNSKVDKVTGKSLVYDTLSAKIQPTVVAVTTKEPLLPSTPTSPENKFLNGNRQWAEMVMGSGGYASNVYFTNLTSTIVGTYKQTSETNELTETIASGTCNNNEVLIHTYLFEQPVGITTIDAGVWRITLNSIIDASAGDSKFKFVQYKRSAAGVETDMFTVYSNTIENRVGYEGYLNNVFETVQPSFATDSLDHLGCRVYATTTAAGNRTLSYKVGDGFASYLNTPLALRHDQNRDKNGNPLYQHATTDQIATWTTTSLNNTVDETLTSIKTKLGAATSVSDGYLKYQDFVRFDGKLSSEVDGSTTNELQTISTNGAAGNITLSNSGGTLNLNVNDADASTTNEIQDLSLSGNTLSLSSDVTTVDISQATAVQANTAKVSNATHTGDVTGSTALTLATVNSNIGTYNNVTINAKGLATAGSNVSYLTGITSGQVTTALGYTPKQTFTESTAFNKNFGTTTGTVLEGRTFGTAASSAVGDFYASGSTVSNSTKWNNISYSLGNVVSPSAILSTDGSNAGYSTNTDIKAWLGLNGMSMQSTGILSPATLVRWDGSKLVNSSLTDDGVVLSTTKGISVLRSGVDRYGMQATGGSGASNILAASQSGVSNGFTVQYNGTSMVYTFNDGSVYAPIFVGNLAGNASTATNVAYSGLTGTVPTWNQNTTGSAATLTTSRTIWGQSFNGSGNVSGAISGATSGDFSGVVTASSFSGSGSNLTGVQLPITLTTNGTSGAATKVGGVINIPNYSSNSVDQTLTTVNGSTGGDIVGSMPFQTANYKKVIVYVNFVSGNATYTFPTQFNTEYNLHTNTLGVSYGSISVSGTSVTITGATNAAGVLIIEGY